MWDEQLEHYADLFVAARLDLTGLTLERFLRNPMLAIASLKDGPPAALWAASRSVSATALARWAAGAPSSGPGCGVRRRAGIREHDLYDRQVRRFMAGAPAR